MCYLRGVVVRTKPTFCHAVLSPYFSTITNSHIDNNPKISGFWYVAKEQYLLTLF